MAQRVRELTRNELFAKFMTFVAVILLLYGLGMTVVILADATTDAIKLRMINVFAGAFAAFVSFGAGFLYGSAAKPDPPKA